MKLKEPRACNASTRRRLNPYYAGLRLDKDKFMLALRMFKALGMLRFSSSSLGVLAQSCKSLYRIVKSLIEDNYTFSIPDESTIITGYSPTQILISRYNKNIPRTVQNTHIYTALKRMSCSLEESMFGLMPTLPSLTELNLTIIACVSETGTSPLPDNILHLRLHGVISNFNLLPKSLQTLHMCFTLHPYHIAARLQLKFTEQLPASLKHLFICAQDQWPLHMPIALPKDLETLELINCTGMMRLRFMKKLKAVRLARCFPGNPTVPKLADSVETMIVQSASDIKIVSLPRSLKHLLVDKNVVIGNTLIKAENLTFLKAPRTSFTKLPENLKELDLSGDCAHQLRLRLPAGFKTLYVDIQQYQDTLDLQRYIRPIEIICYGFIVPNGFQIIPTKIVNDRFEAICSAFHFYRYEEYRFPFLGRDKYRCGTSIDCNDLYPSACCYWKLVVSRMPIQT